MKKNPVYLRELIKTLRAPRMILSIFFFNLALALVGVYTVYLEIEEIGNGGQMNYGIIMTVFRLMALVECLLTFIMMPPLTASAICGEREKGTLSLLLSTGIKSRKIMNGKIGAAISIIMTILISTLPVLSLVYVFGGIRLYSMLLLIGVLGIMAFYIGSICILVSALSRTSTYSLICSYGILSILGFGTLFLAWVWTGSEHFGMQYLLMLNPFTAFYLFVQMEAGNMSGLFDSLGSFQKMFSGMSDHAWLLLSVSVQILTGIGCILGASEKLKKYL